jgi:cell division transport system ATP-binding protein
MSRNPVLAAAQEALSPGPVVRFTDVGMRYGRAPEMLKDISFSLAPGSLTVLTGASGAGKSSLLK